MGQRELQEIVNPRAMVVPERGYYHGPSGSDFLQFLLDPLFGSSNF